MKNIQKNKKPLPECERDVEPVEESPDERAQSLLPHTDGHGTVLPRVAPPHCRGGSGQ